MAMNRTLGPRVEKLERAAGIGNRGGVWFVDFVRVKDGRPFQNELTGCNVDDRLIKRPKGESEVDFIDRMQAELHRPGARTVLIAERQRVNDDA